MDPIESYNRQISRRSLFRSTAFGIGGLALGTLLSDTGAAQSVDPLQRGALGCPHVAPRAKRIIYLFQNGGPAQQDLFDYKPGLAEQFNKDLPDSVRGGQRITGMTSGKTDDFCYNIVENGVSVHDLHATIMYLLGIDHERLTYRYQGRDFRLTDVHGLVVKDLVA